MNETTRITVESLKSFLREELWLLDYVSNENTGKGLYLLLTEDDWELDEKPIEAILAWQTFLRLLEHVADWMIRNNTHLEDNKSNGKD